MTAPDASPVTSAVPLDSGGAACLPGCLPTCVAISNQAINRSTSSGLLCTKQSGNQQSSKINRSTSSGCCTSNQAIRNQAISNQAEAIGRLQAAACPPACWAAVGRPTVRCQPPSPRQLPSRPWMGCGTGQRRQSTEVEAATTSPLPLAHAAAAPL
eukprot:2409268-Prymnesium_polylepis.1